MSRLGQVKIPWSHFVSGHPLSSELLGDDFGVSSRA